MRAWSVMFDRSVTGPIATVGDGRVRVLEATLEEPADPATPRLDAADGPLWLVSRRAALNFARATVLRYGSQTGIART